MQDETPSRPASNSRLVLNLISLVKTSTESMLVVAEDASVTVLIDVVDRANGPMLWLAAV